jgi:hypothetical protein
MVLAGDATEILVADRIDSLQGLGVPPMRELVDKGRAQAVSVFV